MRAFTHKSIREDDNIILQRCHGFSKMTTQQSQGGIVTHVGLALQLILPAWLTMVGKLPLNKRSYAVFTRGCTVSPGFPEVVGTAH